MSSFDLTGLQPDEKFLLSLRTILQHYVGEGNRISRASLALRLKTSDRKVRAAVSELQKRGELIVTDMDGEGYFYLGADTEPAERYIRQEKHRATEIFEKANALENALKAKHGIDAAQGRLC